MEIFGKFVCLKPKTRSPLCKKCRFSSVKFRFWGLGGQGERGVRNGPFEGDSHFHFSCFSFFPFFIFFVVLFVCLFCSLLFLIVSPFFVFSFAVSSYLCFFLLLLMFSSRPIRRQNRMTIFLCENFIFWGFGG